MITGMPRIAIAIHDFDACVATFRERLGMPVIDVSDTSVENLGAKLAMCVPAGGSNIELMSPADPAAPLSQSLQRFLDRRGEGLFALMLEAPDPNTEADLDAVWEQQWRSYHVMQAMRTIEVEFGEIERLAFTRYAREGRPADEVAEALGISIDRVYQAKSRILRRVGALVAEQIRQEG